jgi:hypothetical protein
MACSGMWSPSRQPPPPQSNVTQRTGETTRDITKRRVKDAPSDVTRLLLSIEEWPGKAPDLAAGEARRRGITMTGTSGQRCTNCRGRGWKLLTLRRSLTSAGDAGERASLRRSRVKCLPCQGTGTVQPDPTVTAPVGEGRDDAQQ